MSKLSDCRHEELMHDRNFIWCAYCGKTRQRYGLGNGVNYDD
ncbi:MAG: hypothetical protein ABWY20_08320 [Mycobacterium sp.]